MLHTGEIIIPVKLKIRDFCEPETIVTHMDQYFAFGSGGS